MHYCQLGHGVVTLWCTQSHVFLFDLWPSLDFQSLLDQVTEENKYLMNNLFKIKIVT